MMQKKFIRVKSLATGHQFDIARSTFDPERYERVRRVPDSAYPRRTKHSINHKTSAPSAVEGEALPISVGTDNEGGEP